MIKEILFLVGVEEAKVVLNIVAIIIGSALHKRIRQDVFVKLTYALLVISGITLLT